LVYHLEENDMEPHPAVSESASLTASANRRKFAVKAMVMGVLALSLSILVLVALPLGPCFVVLMDLFAGLLAIFSMILGILGIILQPARRGIAITGLTAGAFALALIVYVLFFMQVLIPHVDVAKTRATQDRMKILANAVKRFAGDTGRLPQDWEGLDVLTECPMADRLTWQGPYLDKPLFDGWDNPFVYEAVYSENSKIDAPTAFIIRSRGVDGIDRTRDDLEFDSWGAKP
jgi:hypothetical protein